MPDITFDVFAADGGILVNGATGSSADFIFALGANSTIQLNSADITSLTVTDDETLQAGDLDGDSPFPGAPNEQAPAGSNQTTDIGSGQQPLYTDFQYTVTANGETFTLYVIDVGNSPNASPGANVAVTFLAFDNNNPPPFDTPLTVTGFAQTTTLPYTDLICFCAGVKILTERGEVPVEDLEVGDMVVTRDNGLQPLRYHAHRKVTPAEMRLRPHFKPVVVRKGALGPNSPQRDIKVSPQHRFVLSGAKCELLFGETEVFASAKSLVNDKSIRIAHGSKRVEYHHLLFDDHQVIFAEGAATESLHPGKKALDGLDYEARREVLELFPELASGDLVAAYGGAAMPVMRGYEGLVAGVEMLDRRRRWGKRGRRAKG